MERKLAAILAADVVGFSRLMESDESRTLARLRERMAAVETRVQEHGGHVFGGAGDSLIAEFPSAVQAVCCALASQGDIARSNQELPAAERLTFRMGVNVGDVLVTEDNFYGDGVNVADRLQQLAEPGGICISETAYLHVHKSITAAYEDLGRVSVKNIAEPIRVYRIRHAAAGPPDRPRRRQRTLALAAGLGILALAAGGLAVWLHPWTTAEAPPQAQMDTRPALAEPKRHFAVDNPADIDDATAMTIYERIRGKMAADYAESSLAAAETYTDWRQYNTAPYQSAEHGRRYVNNYANDDAAAYGRYEQAGEMPAGAIIAKDSFEVTARGDVLSGPLFVMEKMPEGFNDATRDWRYTMILPHGRVFGRTQEDTLNNTGFCADCHHAAGAENDDLFFLPEDYRRAFFRLRE